MALGFAVLSSLCFGVALVTGRVGLRVLDARSGAAVSVPTAALLFMIAAPFTIDIEGFDVRAVLLFAAVGLFFPAIVTLLTFRSNELLGPTITGAVSGTAPLFALLAAALILGERVPAQAALSAAGVVVGVALLSWRKGAARKRFVGGSLLWPIAGAVVRGLAQVGAKAGLLVWANPFAASLIGYLMSSATVVGADRLRQSGKQRLTGKGIAWFGVTGILNGAAVLLMYAALSTAPVWKVAPIVASYPLITAVLGAAILHDERLTLQAFAGATITVAAIVYLVSSHAGA
ncbi:MAG TPA: DMT family transporter [Burkholderiales bacterium]|nr:DMT family transporter [Burkholderiales bacterium]